MRVFNSLFAQFSTSQPTATWNSGGNFAHNLQQILHDISYRDTMKANQPTGSNSWRRTSASLLSLRSPRT